MNIHHPWLLLALVSTIAILSPSTLSEVPCAELEIRLDSGGSPVPEIEGEVAVWCPVREAQASARDAEALLFKLAPAARPALSPFFAQIHATIEVLFRGF